MSDNSPHIASFGQRAGASAINLVIIVLIASLAEVLAGSAQAANPAAQTVIASKTLFGLWVLFWLGCGQIRTSPGLALLKLRVVEETDLTQRISLVTALLRPLPHGLFLAALAFPVHLLPRGIAPVQFLFVLIGALLLAANSTPLWSGPHRRSLLDRWLRTQVVRKN